MGRKTFSTFAELRGVDLLSGPWDKALRRAERSAGRSFTRMERAALRTRRGFLKTGKAIGEIGRAAGRAGKAGALGMAGASAAAAVAVDRFGAYEVEVARIGNLLGPGRDAFAEFDATIRQTSAALGVAPLDVAQAGYQALSSGVDASAASMGEFLDVAGRASVAAGSDMATSVAAITAIMNAYGTETMTAAQVSDRLFKTEALGVTTFGALASEIGGVLSQAKELGVSLDGILAPTASLTKVGLTTSDAMTQISSIMSGIQTGGSGATAAIFQAAGLPTGAEAIRQVGGLDQYIARIRDLVQSGKEIQGKSGNDLITLMFGRKEAQKGLFRLAGSGFEDLIKVTAELADSAGQTDRNFANIQKRTGFRLAQMKTGFTQLVGALGGGLAEGLGLGAVENIPDAVLRASAKIRAGASAFGEAFAEAFDPAMRGAAFDWIGWASRTGKALGQIGTVLVKMTDRIARVLGVVMDVLETGQRVLGLSPAEAAAAAEGGTALRAVMPGERGPMIGWGPGASAGAQGDLVARGLVREVSPAEIAQEAARRRAAGSDRTTAGAWQGPPMPAEVRIKVEAEPGTRVTDARAARKAKAPPVTLDTGRRAR